MDVRTEIDPMLASSELIVRAPSAEAAETLVEACRRITGEQTVSFLIGYRGSDATIIQLRDLIRVATHDRHVEGHTPSGAWRVRQRVGELAQMLPSPPFVQISQAEIVNLSFVHRLDVSLSGTIGVKLTTGETLYVSRRSLVRFKTTLGIS